MQHTAAVVQPAIQALERTVSQQPLVPELPLSALRQQDVRMVFGCKVENVFLLCSNLFAYTCSKININMAHKHGLSHCGQCSLPLLCVPLYSNFAFPFMLCFFFLTWAFPFLPVSLSFSAISAAVLVMSTDPLGCCAL